MKLFLSFSMIIIQPIHRLRYNFQINRSRRANSRMIINQSELVQKMFIIISQLRQSRSNYQLFQKIIKIADYVLLILFTFCSDLLPSQHHPRAMSTPNAVINFKQASNIISFVHLATILTLFLAIFIHIIIEFTLSGHTLRFFSKLLAIIINVSSWLYEVTFIPFLALAVLTYSGSKIFTDSSMSVSLGLLAALFYVIILNDRKVYGRYLPFLFLSRTFLSVEASIFVTIAVSVLCWHSIKRPFEVKHAKIQKVVYLQMALLEVSEYLRNMNGCPITPQVLVNTGIPKTNLVFILAVIPCLQLLTRSELMLRDNNQSEYNDLILNIIQRIQQKSWDSLSVRERLMIEAFITGQQYRWGKRVDVLHETPQEGLWNAFNAKLSRQIVNNPKDIHRLIVRIRLNSLKDTNILSTFKMLEELGLIAGSLRDRFDAFCFIRQTIALLKLHNTLDFQEIKKSDRIQISNERMIQEFIEQLIAFWQYLNGDSLMEEFIMQKLQHLDRKRNVLNKHLEHFKKIPTCRNSLIVLEFALKCLNPQHEITLPSLKGQSRPLNKNMDDGISYFFSIVKDNIQFMSSSLCKRLGYELIFINGASKNNILPPYFSNLQQLLFEQELKGEPAVLPLITAKGSIQPFSGRMMIIANLSGCFSYFFHIQDLSSERVPYLIINCTHQCIEYASKSFKSFFQDNQEERVENIDLQELFCFNFDELVKSSLKECCLEMRARRKEVKSVKVCKICTYMASRCEYLFIRIEVAKGMQRNTMLEIFIQKSTNQTTQDKHEMYKQERFFCKITHPLENKYNQQVQRLSDQNRWTISQKHGRLFLLIILIIVFNIIFSKVIANHNYHSSLTLISELQSVNTARNNLLWLFEDCFQLSYLRQSNSTFLFGNTSIPSLQQEIDVLIHDIQYFRFNYHRTANALQLHLTFPSFALSANTVNTNIVDIIQNAKLFLTQNDPSFLVANVAFIETYNQAYDVVSMMQSETIEQNSTIRYTMVSSIGVICIILIVIFVDLRNSIETSRHIIKVIMNSKEKIIEGKLKLLKRFRHFLTENEEVYFFAEDSSTTLRKNKQLGTLFDQQRQLDMKNEVEMRSTTRREDRNMRKSPVEGEDGKDDKRLLFTLHSKAALFMHRVVVYIREAYFLLIFAIILGYFARLAFLNSHLSEQKSKLLVYGDSFFTTERSILALSVRMYHLALSKGLSTNSDQFSATFLMNTYFTQSLPPKFDSFTQKKNEFVNSNLCQANSEGVTEEFCNQLGGGFLTKGLGVAFQYFVSQVKEIYPSLQSPIDKGQSIFSLSLIDLIKGLMLQKISQIKGAFCEATEDYLKAQASRLIQGILWEQAIMLSGILVIYWFGMRGYRQRCRLVVQGFLMLPKEYILNNRLIKYFKKHSLFERIANI